MRKNNNPPLEYDDVIKRFKEKELKVLSPKYKNNHTPIDCEDKDGYRFRITVNRLSKFTRTKLVYVKNKWSLYNINKYIENNNIKVQILSKEYKNSDNLLCFRCKCGKIFYKSWSDFSYRHSYYCKECLILNNNRRLSEKKVIDDFKSIGLDIIEGQHYLNNSQYLYCKTPEGYIIKKKYVNLKKGNKKNIFSYSHNRENYIYNVNVFLKNNNIPLKCVKLLDFKCGSHGQYFLEAICNCGNYYKTTIEYIKKGNYRCPRCTGSLSNSEYEIASFLKTKNIRYIQQYKFKNCKNIKMLPFDFYLPEYNTCIEFDGAYHYKKQPHVTEEQFKEQCKRDKTKDEYCKNNGIKLIRISYFKFDRKKMDKIIINELPSKCNEL